MNRNFDAWEPLAFKVYCIAVMILAVFSVIAIHYLKPKRIDPYTLMPQPREVVVYQKASIIAEKNHKEVWRKDFAVLMGYRNGLSDLKYCLQRVHPDLKIYILQDSIKARYQCEFIGQYLIPLN